MTRKVRVLNFIIFTNFLHVHPNVLIADSTLSVFCFSEDLVIVFYYSCSSSCLFAFSICQLGFNPSLFDMVSVLLFISSKCVWVNLPDLSVAPKGCFCRHFILVNVLLASFHLSHSNHFNCHGVTSFFHRSTWSSLECLSITVFLFFILCFTTSFSKC